MSGIWIVNDTFSSVEQGFLDLNCFHGPPAAGATLRSGEKPFHVQPHTVQYVWTMHVWRSHFNIAWHAHY